jgi:hypothetical protein
MSVRSCCREAEAGEGAAREQAEAGALRGRRPRQWRRADDVVREQRRGGDAGQPGGAVPRHAPRPLHAQGRLLLLVYSYSTYRITSRDNLSVINLPRLGPPASSLQYFDVAPPSLPRPSGSIVISDLTIPHLPRRGGIERSVISACVCVCRCNALVQGSGAFDLALRSSLLLWSFRSCSCTRVRVLLPGKKNDFVSIFLVLSN